MFSEELFSEVDSSEIPYFFLDSEHYSKQKGASRKGKQVISEPEEEASSGSSVPEESNETLGQLLRKRAASSSKSGKVLRPKRARVEQTVVSREEYSSTPPFVAGSGFSPSPASPSLGASMCNLMITQEGLSHWRSCSDEERGGAVFDNISLVSYFTSLLFFLTLCDFVAELCFLWYRSCMVFIPPIPSAFLN